MHQNNTKIYLDTLSMTYLNKCKYDFDTYKQHNSITITKCMSSTVLSLHIQSKHSDDLLLITRMCKLMYLSI